MNFIQKAIFAAGIASILVLIGCNNTDNTNDGPDNPSTEGPRLSLPNNCKRAKEYCNMPTGAQSNNRFCSWQNDDCIEAEECSQIIPAYCSQADYIPGKKCGKRSNKCVEIADCDTFTTAGSCQGKFATGTNDHVCAWSYQKHRCESVSPSYAKRDSALKIFAGGGTVCVKNNTPDDIVCWGNDTGKKYSEGFIPNDQIESMALNNNSACAVIETAAPNPAHANNGEYKVKCWGANAQINNAPTDKIVRNSLRVNNHVACARLVDAARPVSQEIKCWGDFASTMENAQAAPIKISPTGILTRDLGVAGVSSLKAQQFDLGSDFITALVEPVAVGVNPPPVLWVSGKTNFSPLKNVGLSAGASPLKHNSLTAAADFACYIDDQGPNKDKALCFKQPTNAASYTDTFLFAGGATHSPDTFDWIKAMSNYMCGMKATDSKPTCYVPAGAGTSPATAVPAIAFNKSAEDFAFGDDFICGITAQKKVNCWGSNTAIVDGIPDSLKHQ